MAGLCGECQYIVRNIDASNHLFGDDIAFHGILETADGPSLVTSQPFVDGTSPTAKEDANEATKHDPLISKLPNYLAWYRSHGGIGKL